MTEAFLSARVKSLETQLAVLKAQMGKPPIRSGSGSLADLRGILKGIAESDETEIHAAEYRLSWEGDAEP